MQRKRRIPLVQVTQELSVCHKTPSCGLNVMLLNSGLIKTSVLDTLYPFN